MLCFHNIWSCALSQLKMCKVLKTLHFLLLVRCPFLFLLPGWESNSLPNAPRKKTVQKCWILSHPQSFPSFSRSWKKGKQSSSEMVFIWETIPFSAPKCWLHCARGACTPWDQHLQLLGCPKHPNGSQRNKMNNFGECLGDAGWQPFSDCCAFAFTEAFPGCGCSKWSQKGFYTECKYNLMGEDFDSLEGCAAV